MFPKETLITNVTLVAWATNMRSTHNTPTVSPHPLGSEGGKVLRFSGWQSEDANSLLFREVLSSCLCLLVDVTNWGVRDMKRRLLSPEQQTSPRTPH